MNSDQAAIIKRIRRKVEILKMDFKSQNKMRHHDMNEIILLIDMLERS